TLQFTRNALEDIEELKKSGDKVILKKLSSILQELIEHPRTGTGHPEELKHNLLGCWSRRISGKHRIVYKIEDEKVTVIVLYARGHYGDK
ncbi:MAG TPA: Txe/YoeB family addiction module toxin, partial [Bacteroidales bacterium]|nr:Txe/YoeB family addiction module toxin [Bacteroidales bacterium]